MYINNMLGEYIIIQFVAEKVRSAGNETRETRMQSPKGNGAMTEALP
jgi:hypothetical protein